eukprot:131047-Pelagomonas_calceolata.AAC.2
MVLQLSIQCQGTLELQQSGPMIKYLLPGKRGARCIVRTAVRPAACRSAQARAQAHPERQVTSRTAERQYTAIFDSNEVQRLTQQRQPRDADTASKRRTVTLGKCTSQWCPRKG